MVLSSTFEEAEPCVICLEPFLSPSADGGKPEAVDDTAAASAAAPSATAVDSLDIDTDTKKKNKTVTVPLDDPPETAQESISLPPLPPNFLSEVASLSGCDHKYHDKCIKEWSSVTNSCPTCRAKFNEVTVHSGLGGPVARTYKVRNKRAPAVPHPEDDGPGQQLGMFAPVVMQFFASSDEVCTICGSEDSLMEIAVCFCCQQSYHTRCLQANYESPNMTCPTCQLALFSNGSNTFQTYESEQSSEYPEEAIYNMFRGAARRRAAGRVTNANGVRASSRLLELRRMREFNEAVSQISAHIMRTQGMFQDDVSDELSDTTRREQARVRNQVPPGRHSSRYTRPRPGSLLGTSVSTPPPPPPPAQPARPQMSPEEVEAWSVLDRAQQDESAAAVSPTTTRQRGRARPPTSESSARPKRPRENSVTESTVPAAASASSSSASQPEKKYKRPSRRSSQFPRTATDEAGANTTVPASSSSPSASSANPTPVQLLLSTIRSSTQPTAPSPVMAPTPVSNYFGPLHASSSPSPSSPLSPSSPSPATSVSSSPVRPSSPVVYDPQSMSASPFAPGPQPDLLYSPCSDGELNKPPPRFSSRPSRVLDSGSSSDPEQSSSSSSRHPPSTSSSSSSRPVELNLEDKEKIQGLVRDVLRPLYRGGKITKDEYTSINQRVSRVMYRHVYRERDRRPGRSGSAAGTIVAGAPSKQLENWKNLVEHYVRKERERTAAVVSPSKA